MKRLNTFTLVVLLVIGCTSFNSNWTVHYSVVSGWGFDKGVRVWSGGQVARCTTQICDAVEDCLAASLSDAETAALSELVNAVPTGDRYIMVPDDCYDEPEHNVQIHKRGREYGFSYSTGGSTCLTSNAVPTWMKQLAERMKEINESSPSCENDA